MLHDGRLLRWKLIRRLIQDLPGPTNVHRLPSRTYGYCERPIRRRHQPQCDEPPLVRPSALGSLLDELRRSRPAPLEPSKACGHGERRLMRLLSADFSRLLYASLSAVAQVFEERFYACWSRRGQSAQNCDLSSGELCHYMRFLFGIQGISCTVRRRHFAGLTVMEVPHRLSDGAPRTISERRSRRRRSRRHGSR